MSRHDLSAVVPNEWLASSKELQGFDVKEWQKGPEYFSSNIFLKFNGYQNSHLTISIIQIMIRLPTPPTDIKHKKQ